MTISKSSKHLQGREAPPAVTPAIWKEVSGARREYLEQEVAEGKFREPGAIDSPYVKSIQKTAAGTVIGSGQNKLTKIAAFSSSVSGGTGGNWRGSGGTVRQVPEVYSPLWLNSNLNIPRDRATINSWTRSFFAANPIVQNAISLHSTYPISKLNIKCKNEKVKQFFEEMNEEIDLLSICVQIAQEYWTLGEAFVYAELDERKAKWSRLLIQNPDYMVVKRSVIAGEPIISLRPDENLRRICTSNSPGAIQQRQQIDPSIVEHVRRGENIPLSNFYVSHLARRIAPYEIRGTSLIVSIFKQLMLFDRIYECKFAQADDLVNPITLVKIGGGADGFKPTPADLEAYRQVFEEATYDKLFKIFTHDAVTVERIGAGQGIYDTSNDIDRLIKLIYIGLMAPSVIMDGGGDITYANGTVSLDVLRQRYMQFREMLSKWLRRKIFAPIAKINDFYDRVDGEKRLIVPEVEWNHMSLFDMNDYIQNLNTLVQAQPMKMVSLQTVYRSLGLEYEDEVRRIKREAIDAAIFAKEQEQLTAMSLNDLRGLSADEEIPEIHRTGLPGEDPSVASGGDAGMGGLPGVGPMPDLGMGGPMPTPPPMGPEGGSVPGGGAPPGPPPLT